MPNEKTKLERIDHWLYFFAQRHYWASPLVDRIRWFVEGRKENNAERKD